MTGNEAALKISGWLVNMMDISYAQKDYEKFDTIFNIWKTINDEVASGEFN